MPGGSFLMQIFALRLITEIRAIIGFRLHCGFRYLNWAQHLSTSMGAFFVLWIFCRSVRSVKSTATSRNFYFDSRWLRSRFHKVTSFRAGAVGLLIVSFWVAAWTRSLENCCTKMVSLEFFELYLYWKLDYCLNSSSSKTDLIQSPLTTSFRPSRHH